MKAILITLLFGIIVFTLSSCSKSNPVNSPIEQPVNPEQQIIPLTIGNFWVMQYTVYDSTGTIVGTISDTSSVTSDTLVDGLTWYYISSKVSRGPIFYTNKSDGLWEMVAGSSVGPTLLYKYPANIGDSWNVQTIATPIINQGFLQSDSISVTVPEGTYSCYQYKMLDNSQLVEQVDLVPGLGDVEIDIYLTTTSGRSYHQIHGELISANIK